MSDTITKPRSLPEVWMDEDGNGYFAEGHIEPHRFLLACVVDTLVNCGPIEVASLLLVSQGQDDAREWAASRVHDVKHEWFAMSPADEERMERCDPFTDGGGPFTTLSL